MPSLVEPRVASQQQGSPRRSRTDSGYLVCESAVGLIGATPLVKLASFSPPGGATLWAKVELANIGGSVKDRPALNMLRAAQEQGLIAEGGTIIEATSGNTGISLALLSAMFGYQCVIVMPEDMSLERRYLLKAYGAEIELTPPAAGMVMAVERARELTRKTPGAFMPSQFDNPANPEAHECTTGQELIEQVPEPFRAFIAGVGTGGTITGVGRALKRMRPAVRVIGVEPAASPVLSGGKAGLHGIQGIGAGFVPEILDRSVMHEVVPVTDPAALRMARRIARQEGLLVGPSSGANLAAAVEVAKRYDSGAVVTLLCDTGERYLF